VGNKVSLQERKPVRVNLQEIKPVRLNLLIRGRTSVTGRYGRPTIRDEPNIYELDWSRKPRKGRITQPQT